MVNGELGATGNCFAKQITRWRREVGIFRAYWETITKIGLRMSCLRWVIGEKRKPKEIGIVSKYFVDMLIKNRIYFLAFSKV